MKAKRILAALALWGIAAAGGSGLRLNATPGPPEIVYHLLTGSELLDDCPVCDRLSRPIPLSGSFRLRLQESNPLFATYELSAIALSASGGEGETYSVTGGGTYRSGGAQGENQEMFLNVTITDASAPTVCYLTNAVSGKPGQWPLIAVDTVQTNGTIANEYHLKLLAAPDPEFVGILPDPTTGNVRLEWSARAANVQLERAENPAGPYLPLPAVGGSSFTDPGALTNRSQYFYRLRRQ